MAAKLKAKLRVESTAPTVIDDGLIRLSISELPSGSEEKMKETMDLREVQYIAEIENLAGFRSLTKLQLDNNRITEIKNLNHLTSLTWLDLSFNQIKKIEGLDQLTKLTDLSLFHNEITVVENLENLVELKVLSIGDNQIKNLDKLVHYLRGFKKLRVLNLKGNRAIYDDPECRNYVIAFVKQLRYLDYKLITDEEKQSARNQLENEIMQFEEDDRAAEQKAREAAKVAAKQQVLADANVQGIDDFLELSFKEDPEIIKLTPIAAEVLLPYEEALGRYKEYVTEFIQIMMERAQQKQEEKRQYWQAVTEVSRTCEDAAKADIRDFEARKKKITRELEGVEATPENSGPVRDLFESTKLLQDRLMDLEIQQVEQIEELTREFINVMKELNLLSSETIQRFFGGQLRPLIQEAKQAVDGCLERELERYAAAVTEEQLAAWTEDQQRLLDDKEALHTGLGSSHEQRNTKIDLIEDAINKRESEQLEAYIAKLRDDERDRNRLRVKEIWTYVELQRVELRQNYEDFLEGDEDESGSDGDEPDNGT